MKFTNDELLALAALPDDKLWAEIEKIASSYGIKLPDKTPSHEELEKLRQIATCGKISMPEAMRLVNKYKKGDYK